MFPYLFTAFLSWRVEGTFDVIFMLIPKVGISGFRRDKPERPQGRRRVRRRKRERDPSSVIHPAPTSTSLPAREPGSRASRNPTPSTPLRPSLLPWSTYICSAGSALIEQ